MLTFIFTVFNFFLPQVHSEAGVGDEEVGVGGSRGPARVGETDSEAPRRDVKVIHLMVCIQEDTC